MNAIKIDSRDKRLIQLLSDNGRMRAKELAKKLDVSAPTVQSRMKWLINQGILKVAGLVDTFKTNGIIVAIIAIRVDDVAKMANAFEELSKLKQVSWIVAVTGQFDFFTEIIITEGIESVFDFHVNEISKIDGVSHAESFMVTKAHNKWTTLTPDIDSWVE
jgi:Lrp/AsnC family transcriptional regulator for asnA, asnC and gidA